MPRKPSTIIPMQSYPAFSSRRWYAATVESVARPGKPLVRFVLSLLNDPRQAGRQVTHDIPALLAPGSPLYHFLANGFDVHPTTKDQVDLTTIVGRVVELRFTPAGDNDVQSVSSVRMHSQPVKRVKFSTQTSEEARNGLG
ncbi:MAG: hypothetical protein H6819_06990 [Phycisphaerales bacterium]|nr:hypothetical protein [Phycisphaerales bacterium]MCB9855327.1 hypothetical protein [Phycisphaerales bacterium]MCB9862920.1 hypothetical protein [Phycisphaerales bacterium]